MYLAGLFFHVCHISALKSNANHLFSLIMSQLSIASTNASSLSVAYLTECDVLICTIMTLVIIMLSLKLLL